MTAGDRNVTSHEAGGVRVRGRDRAKKRNPLDRATLEQRRLRWSGR